MFVAPLGPPKLGAPVQWTAWTPGFYTPLVTKESACSDTRCICVYFVFCQFRSAFLPKYMFGYCFVTACESRQFYCPEGYCIPASWTCDNIVDCRDGDDERNCCKTIAELYEPFTTLTNTMSVNFCSEKSINGIFYTKRNCTTKRVVILLKRHNTLCITLDSVVGLCSLLRI